MRGAFTPGHTGSSLSLDQLRIIYRTALVTFDDVYEAAEAGGPQGETLDFTGGPLPNAYNTPTHLAGLALAYRGEPYETASRSERRCATLASESLISKQRAPEVNPRRPRKRFSPRPRNLNAAAL